MDPVTLLPEFDHEVASTCRMLEALQDDHLDYRPHQKSWTTRELATHVATVFGWTRPTLELDGIDLAGFEPAQPLAGRAEIVELFENNARDARGALEESDAGVMAEAWTLRNGDEVHFSMPKGAVYRSFVMNHLIHHRGQLAVHLRASGCAVPGMYGPSADESF